MIWTKPPKFLLLLHSIIHILTEDFRNNERGELEDQISKSKKLSTEDRIMTAITTICPSVTSMVPKVRVPET